MVEILFYNRGKGGIYSAADIICLYGKYVSESNG